jgi:hypothetical protein
MARPDVSFSLRIDHREVITMGRLNMRPREATTKKKEVAPVWRGVGCIMFVILTVGSYFASGAIINALNEAHAKKPFLPGALAKSGIPTPYVVLFTYAFPREIHEIGPIKLEKPLRSFALRVDYVNLGFTVIFSILIYGMVVMVWAILNPVKLGPKDAPPPDRKIDRNKIR